jgi:hypothetical protein
MSFSRMINWTASWPYVYRTLLPASVRLIAEITPARFKARVSHSVREKPYFKKIGWTHVIVQGLIWLGIIAALVDVFGGNPGNRAAFQWFWNFRTFVSEVPTYHVVSSGLFPMVLGFFIARVSPTKRVNNRGWQDIQ